MERAAHRMDKARGAWFSRSRDGTRGVFFWLRGLFAVINVARSGDRSKGPMQAAQDESMMPSEVRPRLAL